MYLSHLMFYLLFFFFSSRRRHTRCSRDWSSDVCSSDLTVNDERLGFEFLEVMPHRVGRDAECVGELLRCARLGTLQLEQDLTPKSFMCRELRRSAAHGRANPKGSTRDCQLK